MNNKKITGIYKIENPNGSIYIGQSVDIHYRWYEYKSISCEGQTRLHNSLKKHGIENHKFEILEECSREMLNEREIYWIQFYNSFNTPHGMNLQSGGGVGLEVSEETRERMRASGKVKVFTEEHKNNISKANKGMTSPTLGKVYSEEEKQKLSLVLTGKTRTEETKKKMSKAQMGNKKGLGTKRSAETKEKQSKAQTGKKLKEETKEKLRIARTGKKLSPESIRKREETKKRNRYLKLHTTQSIIFRSQILNNWDSLSKNLPSYTT